MDYRREIDGLRAIAVLSVILFHAGFEIFSGGFLGVDVFFVISGFLITQILLRDIIRQRFSIISFYERRARRILPALFFVICVTIPAALVLMQPEQLVDYAQSLVAVTFFASNFLFWHESDYFGATSEEKPLLHTWSLGIEEQYYLFFPILLALCWNRGRNFTFWVIVIMTSASLLLTNVVRPIDASANFYLAPTRFWELGVGSLAAFFSERNPTSRSDLFSTVGLAALIGSMATATDLTPTPSFLTTIPVFGTALILLFAKEGTLVARLLSFKGFTAIGLISYSAYLWHQPIFAFSRMHAIEPAPQAMVLLSILSLLLAVFTWRFVETPFRNRTKVSSAAIFKYSSVALASLASIGMVGLLSSERFRSEYQNSLTVDQQLYTKCSIGAIRTHQNSLRNGNMAAATTAPALRRLGDTWVKIASSCHGRRKTYF